MVGVVLPMQGSHIGPNERQLADAWCGGTMSAVEKLRVAFTNDAFFPGLEVTCLRM